MASPSFKQGDSSLNQKKQMSSDKDQKKSDHQSGGVKKPKDQNESQTKKNSQSGHVR